MANIKSIGGNPIVPDQISGGATEGNYALLTAGAALGITGDGPIDSAAWLQRVSTSDGPTTIRSIHGRTLRWNQLAKQVSAENWGINYSVDSANLSFSDGIATVSIVSEPASSSAASWVYGITSKPNTEVPVSAGHKFLISFDYKPSSANDVVYTAINNTSTIRSAGGVAGTWNHYAWIVQQPEDATIRPSFRLAAGYSTTTLSVNSTIQYKNVNVFDLTAMFGAGSEPSTIEEFTALYPLPYYEYDAGSLLPVNMEGIETTGFNQWDEQWEVGGLSDINGAPTSASDRIRSKNFIPVIGGAAYFYTNSVSVSNNYAKVYFYDAGYEYIGNDGPYSPTSTTNPSYHNPFTVPQGARYLKFAPTPAYGSVYRNDICINLSDPTRNGEYAPYWHQERTIPAGTLRSAGTAYDEQTETERIVRVGERAYQSGDESDPTVTTDGTITYYPLTTPTVTTYDPPLNLTYRTASGGVERIMVPAGELSAPPTIVAAQGYTAESLRDAALSAIAPVENGLASTNYGVGSYLVHGGQLCRVTTAIATGESITIGTNVTATTVMAEVIALIAQ